MNSMAAASHVAEANPECERIRAPILGKFSNGFVLPVRKLCSITSLSSPSRLLLMRREGAGAARIREPVRSRPPRRPTSFGPGPAWQPTPYNARDAIKREIASRRGRKGRSEKAVGVLARGREFSFRWRFCRTRALADRSRWRVCRSVPPCPCRCARRTSLRAQATRCRFRLPHPPDRLS